MSFREVVIGPCRLICGDCMDVLPTLDKVDAVVTDPPFGIGFAAQPTKWQREAGAKPTSWDDAAPQEIVERLLDIGQHFVIWGGNYFRLPPSRGWLTWYKPDSPPSMASFEMAWTNQDKNARQIERSISATNSERVGHPTQKPLCVMQFSIDYLPACEIILDPFMGSGTTGVACIQTERRFIGIEKEEKYFDIACQRIQRAWDLKCSELPFEKPTPARQLSLIE